MPDQSCHYQIAFSTIRPLRYHIKCQGRGINLSIQGRLLELSLIYMTIMQHHISLDSRGFEFGTNSNLIFIQNIQKLPLTISIFQNQRQFYSYPILYMMGSLFTFNQVTNVKKIHTHGTHQLIIPHFLI